MSIRFDLERPKSAQYHVGRERRISRVQPWPASEGVEATATVFGFSSTYAYTLRHKMTKFGVGTHMGCVSE